MTPTTVGVGWVLAEVHCADGTILDSHEFELCGAAVCVCTVNIAKQVAGEVWRVNAMAAADS